MKKEDGMTSLNMLVTLVIAIIIGSVIIAMVFEKPKKLTNEQNTENTVNTQEENNTIIN